MCPTAPAGTELEYHNRSSPSVAAGVGVVVCQIPPNKTKGCMLRFTFRPCSSRLCHTSLPSTLTSYKLYRPIFKRGEGMWGISVPLLFLHKWVTYGSQMEGNYSTKKMRRHPALVSKGKSEIIDSGK